MDKGPNKRLTEMELGWIDFSKNERDKILGVLDSLTEQGTLDELGIAPIRDGFSDLFFPGTSTLQTRAKYFLLIPYACKDLEQSGITNAKLAYEKLYSIERDTALLLTKSNSEEKGIIGGSFINRKQWIKRPPSTLYWAGLRRYGIFKGEYSVSEYLKAACALKMENDTLKKLGNRSDTEDTDDKDAGKERSYRFFNAPTYNSDWKENLTIRLTTSEALFLKEKIRIAAPDSLLTYLLSLKDESEIKNIFNCNSFEALSALIKDERLKADCEIAVGFSKFLYVLRVVYNLVVSDGKNKAANNEIDMLLPEFNKLSEIDIDAIFLRLNIQNDKLRKFITETKNAMANGDVSRLKSLVTERERNIKGTSRAKTMNAGMFDENKWFGGGYLDYRLSQVQQMLKDIFDGETTNV